MEISFTSREIPVYREYLRQTRRVQESVECVVPDTDADIEKIITLQSEVFLKSKDLTGRGVLISGELSANVLYIREGRTGVSGLRMKKPFSIEYEAEELESETMAQISLRIQGADVRVVNPRKVSVLFEVEGELSCFRGESLCVESGLPEKAAPVHVQTQLHELILPNAVCEKSAAVSEQFSFPAGQPLPSRLLSERADLRILDTQLIGSKVIVKGDVALTVVSQAEDSELMQTHSFSAPFSQIADIGAESMSFCAVRTEITGSYYDLIDTVSGEKALDMELHLVLQLVSYERHVARSIGDAYSNLMPEELKFITRSFETADAVQKRRISAEERIELSEDQRELMCLFASPARVSGEADKLSAAITLDLLFLHTDGNLSTGRRTLTLSQDTEGMLRVLNVRLLSLSTVPDGKTVLCSVTLEADCLSCETAELRAVSAVLLDEEAAYDQESFPTLTLVRTEGESLWTLARRYHSSVEKIRESNKDAENPSRMLLIPKCL